MIFCYREKKHDNEEWKDILLTHQWSHSDIVRITNFNFSYYDFKINDEIFTENSSAWEEKINEFKIWVKLTTQ